MQNSNKNSAVKESSSRKTTATARSGKGQNNVYVKLRLADNPVDFSQHLAQEGVGYTGPAIFESY